MKRDCPLNVSWLTYSATAPSLVATLVLTTGSVVQHMGRKMSSRDAQVSNIVVTITLTICSMEALVLFNSGTIYSLVAPSFALCLDMKFDVKQSIGSAYSGSGGVYNNQVFVWM